MAYYLKDPENVLVILYYTPVGISGKDLIPSTITTLGEECFKNKTLPTTVEVPSSVTTIQKKAFDGVLNTKKIIICDSVTKIDDFAFSNMLDLEEIILPENVICGISLFFNCPKLHTIYQGKNKYNIFFYNQYNRLILADECPELNTQDIKVFYGTCVPYTFPSNNLAQWTPHLKYYCVINRGGIKYIWSDERLEFAKRGVEYFASRRSFNSYFHRIYKINDYITPDDFSLLCGICSEGIRWFYHKTKIPYGTPVKLTQIFDLSYAYFPETFKRIKYGFEHQNEVTDVWDYSILDWGEKEGY